MLKTVNLSKARAASRQKRAKKAVSVLKEQFSEDTKISRELNEHIWQDGAQQPPRKVTVEEIDGVLYPAGTEETVTEQKEGEAESKETEEVSEESETSEADYSEIVGGTISEAKEQVNELEDPDYEALIEAEESGKDRKTLKEWFESQK